MGLSNMLGLFEADDGKMYHAQQNEAGGWDFILDDDGDLIPASACICHAHEPGECCCATTSFDDYEYDDDY